MAAGAGVWRTGAPRHRPPSPGPVLTAVLAGAQPASGPPPPGTVLTAVPDPADSCWRALSVKRFLWDCTAGPQYMAGRPAAGVGKVTWGAVL